MNSFSNNTTTTNQPSNASNQNEDYLDKGLDAAEKKWGGSLGQDTQKNRNVNEKIVSRCPHTRTLAHRHCCASC